MAEATSPSCHVPPPPAMPMAAMPTNIPTPAPTAPTIAALRALFFVARQTATRRIRSLAIVRGVPSRWTSEMPPTVAEANCPSIATLPGGAESLKSLTRIRLPGCTATTRVQSVMTGSACRIPLNSINAANAAKPSLTRSLFQRRQYDFADGRLAFLHACMTRHRVLDTAQGTDRISALAGIPLSALVRAVKGGEPSNRFNPADGTLNLLSSFALPQTSHRREVRTLHGAGPFACGADGTARPQRSRKTHTRDRAGTAEGEALALRCTSRQRTAQSADELVATDPQSAQVAQHAQCDAIPMEPSVGQVLNVARSHRASTSSRERIRP